MLGPKPLMLVHARGDEVVPYMFSEEIYELAEEPKRLLPRYFYTNPRFVVAFARQYLSEKRRSRRPG